TRYTPTESGDASSLGEKLRIGLSDNDYREIVLWLTEQIKHHTEIDETVSSVDDLPCFALEISSFLKELACPYHSLLEGPMSARFRSEYDALLLVDYLVGECIAGLIGNQKRDEEQREFQLQIQTSTPSNELRQMFDHLNLDVQNVPSSVGEIFDLMHNRLNELTDVHTQSDLLFRPETDLTDDQWARLDRCHADLQEEYNLRRVMMTTRLDLTMASFQWKANTSLEVARVCRQRKRNISALADSLSKRDISDLLVTTRDLLRLEKVTSTRFKGSRKNVFQGNLVIPNRGGVVSVQAKPWMPVWSSREEGQPCENLRQKYRKQPKVQTEPTKDYHSGKKSKRKQRKGSGDIEETELNLD
ncbi:protein FAM98B-like, partial [Ochlerotatus camptorhynchus]|uniref:protein FAM98B-like n=1 Tax=Ochlerotatus camptorhynchus TaxID=644619 RepID=UPI0031DEA3EA